jgi:hypothetical protein
MQANKGSICYWCSPGRKKEVQEARWLGKLRRKQESIASSAYQFKSLVSLDGIMRIVLIAVSVENSISCARTLAYLAQVALRILEVGEIEESVTALEKLAKMKK